MLGGALLMNKAFIVSGCCFGDEGKGTLSDYLAHKYNLKENIRYNGGSHASHTVIVDGILHKFSQLGSIFLNENTRTYLSANTIVNPFNLVTEAQNLATKTGMKVEDILARIYIDKNASVVTPYHSLINKVRELSDESKRTGSVGTGVSEVNKVKKITGIEIKMKDFLNNDARYKLLELFMYTRKFVLKNKDKIDEDKYYKYIDVQELEKLIAMRNKYYIISCYQNIMKSNLLNIVNGIEEFHQDNNMLFEGSQAVLIDHEYGFKPNTTSLDTTNHYGVKLANELKMDVIKYGAISSLASRHGMGPLPTYDDYLEERIFDSNQTPSYYQGVPTYGWFDAVLIRYSLKVSENDYLFMSALDRLSKLDYLKVCNEYLYKGIIDEEFKEIFSYEEDKGNIIIHDINKPSDNLKKYIVNCVPIYITLPSFKEDIGKITEFKSLPIECQHYVALIEKLINKKITLVGVGPERRQKLERKPLI